MLNNLLGLMQLAKQGYGLYDDTDTLCYANPVFREIFDLAENEFPTWVELLRKNYAKGVGTNIASREFESWLASATSRRGKLPYRTIETDLHDGRWVLTTETTSPEGWMLCVITDITEFATDSRTLRQQRDHALKSATTDELTGLSNRRYLMTSLGRILSAEKAVDVAAVLLDIDHFKKVNDTYGHAVGDVVLRHFALQLQTHIRRDDFAGRIGGEEFLLIFLGVTVENAQDMLERLFTAVRASSPLIDIQTFRYTFSAGVAFAKPGESSDELLQRADVMLYQAKRDGRNRWVVDSGFVAGRRLSCTKMI